MKLRGVKKSDKHDVWRTEIKLRRGRTLPARILNLIRKYEALEVEEP